MRRRRFLAGAAGAAGALAGCGALGSDPTGGAPLAWRFDNGATIGTVSAPGTGRLYLTGRTPEGDGGRLVELDAGTGESTERTRVETAADMSVLAAAGAVYLWINRLGGRGIVVATDAGGRRLWRDRSVFGLPAVADGLAYVRGHVAVRAVDARTGEQWWRLRLDDEHLARTRELVAPENWRRLLLVGSAAVVSVDIGGARRWTVEREGRGTVPLSVGEGTVYVGDNPVGDTATVSAHAPGGRTRWRTTVPAGIAIPTAAPDGAYVSAWTGDGPVLIALRPDGTGWRVPGFRFGARFPGGVAGVGDRGAVAFSRDGTEQWRFVPDGDRRASVWPVGDGLLAVAGETATALSPQGDVLWQYDTDAPVEDVVVGDGRTYLLTGRRLHALG